LPNYGVDSIMPGSKRTWRLWVSTTMVIGKTLVYGGRVEATLAELTARGLAYGRKGPWVRLDRPCDTRTGCFASPPVN
jgi:hypothetical protein